MADCAEQQQEGLVSSCVYASMGVRECAHLHGSVDKHTHEDFDEPADGSRTSKNKPADQNNHLGAESRAKRAGWVGGWNDERAEAEQTT